MQSVGINIGSSSLKVACVADGKLLWAESIPHEGNFHIAAEKIFSNHTVEKDARALATGTEGRFLFSVNKTVEPLCIEEALKHLNLRADAIVSLGGEDLVVYTLNEDGRIVNNFSGSKCASGTGEFFKQQLARMDMKLEDVNSVPDTAHILELSTRCSVFMKSDCTHRLNKGEATKEDIVLSLSNVMAVKVIDFLKKARISKGKVILVGGITRNRHIVRFIKEKAPDIQFIIPEEASYFEALGAAYLAEKDGSPMPEPSKLITKNKVSFTHLESLKTQLSKVTYFPAKHGRTVAGREYILGVDGGSTTTKACLIDMETDEITASFYGRTHGDPVKALKQCLQEIKKQVKADIGDGKINITLASTTGSSREILGVFLETPAVYNEIIAHTEGTTYFADDVDTIFEIGGQDAKYVLLKNKVPIDYAMNEACSAGTGSFLEESASGDLNIAHAWEIGDIALEAENPLKFGEHCSAFINSDIRKAIQQGATRADITAGIVTSIVSNYLNRVVGNRTVGNKIFLQGGVAKNKAIPLAFALLLGKEILVPPDPELMGCFGVGLLAKQKFKEGLISKATFDIDKILETEIIYESEFKCKSCENQCPIRILKVNGNKYMFGGRCSKYTNSRKKKLFDESQIRNFVDERNNLMFKTFAPDEASFIKKRDYTVGIPKAFSVYTLYPFYSWYFHQLGIKTVLSDKVPHAGVARTESTYCFPAEIAHGAVQDILDKKTDYIFLPHYRDMPSHESDIHANFCPITQSLPYYIRKAFPEIPEDKILSPVVSFRTGLEKATEFFVELGQRLGFSASEAKSAFDVALKKQNDYQEAAFKLGEEALEYAKSQKQPVIALLGRPYNAFAKEANIGIPRKFTSRGNTVIPFDILPIGDKKIFPNMYWYYGQKDMHTAFNMKDNPNIFVTWVSNFSCAPDSFMLHYLKWIMGTKPFLVLELDSHSADAGVDTRVEAFLDIIEGYRLKYSGKDDERYDNGLRFVNDGKSEPHLHNEHTGEDIAIRGNKKVKILLSNMGDISARSMAATAQSLGFNAEAVPIPTPRTLRFARNHASGKECVPSLLLLGSMLEYFASDKYDKGTTYMIFVPITTGPCRTGQYFVFYQNLFRDLRLENVVVFTLSADHSYSELGAGFSKIMWWALCAADYLKDIQTVLRTCAKDRTYAMNEVQEGVKYVLEEARKGWKNIVPALRVFADRVKKIPLKKDPATCPKVLVVGEIYVRRDDYAVDEIIRSCADKGIIAKVSGIGEWIHYTDFVQEYFLKRERTVFPWYKKIFSDNTKKLLILKLAEAWKESTEAKIREALEPSGLIPESPHDMKKIMANTLKFVSYELNSEISISSGAAATAMEEGYSGVVNISPFACLIGRVIEGLYMPYARQHKYPAISIEIDGNQLPPNIINKLNIFMLNVIRYKENPGVAELIDYEDEK